MNIEFKNFEAKLADFDQKGVVTIYANAYDNKDADGDISAKGSFTKTATENFTRIKHFLNHDGRLLVGIPLEIDTNDPYGLKIRSQLNLQKQLGRDTYEDYKLYNEHGRSLEHSVGYQVVKRDEKQKSIITEYKLWEYSTLTSWGANEKTPLVSLKNIKTTEELIDFLVKMYNKPYSDERLIQVETILNSLENDEPIDGKQADEALTAPENAVTSTEENHSQEQEPNDDLNAKLIELELMSKINLLNAKVQKT